MFRLVEKDNDIIKTASLAEIIWHEAYKDTLTKKQIEYMIEKFQSAPTIKKQINDNFYYYLVYDKEEAIGFFSYTISDVIFLSKIYILSSARNQGYAKKIISFLKGYKLPIELRVNKENQRAINAYLKMGFNKIDELKTAIGNNFYMDDYIMRRDFSFLDLIYVEQEKPYFKNILNQITKTSLNEVVYPKKEDWFKALELTEYNDVKVVLIGQDPYFNPNQAMGLSFSVNKGIKIPPSLVNIYKEIESEYGQSMPNHGDLTGWAKQGVLLLNSVLTVSAGRPLSHQDFGWQKFTDEVIKMLQKKDFVVYMLLGGHAKKYKKLITNKNHVILETSHPSPLSSYRGFLGSNIFKEVNLKLKENKEEIINWYLL